MTRTDSSCKGLKVLEAHTTYMSSLHLPRATRSLCCSILRRMCLLVVLMSGRNIQDQYKREGQTYAMLSSKSASRLSSANGRLKLCISHLVFQTYSMPRRWSVDGVNLSNAAEHNSRERIPEGRHYPSESQTQLRHRRKPPRTSAVTEVQYHEQ